MKERIKVLAAHGDRELLLEMEGLLRENGFETVIAKDGLKALQLLEIERPEVVVIDVALPGYLGFEICRFVREVEDLKWIKILLVASIYGKRRYKRPPSSLYGADDYIEIHHIKDMLISKVRRLVGLEPGGRIQAPLKLEPYEEKVCQIERLARLIVADILLYNEDRLREGIMTDRVYELLREDIEEGRRYLAQRIPESKRYGKDYIREALEDFLEKKREEMGLLE